MSKGDESLGLVPVAVVVQETTEPILTHIPRPLPHDAVILKCKPIEKGTEKHALPLFSVGRTTAPGQTGLCIYATHFCTPRSN